jgi:hypothetical protein
MLSLTAKGLNTYVNKVFLFFIFNTFENISENLFLLCQGEKGGKTIESILEQGKMWKKYLNTFQLHCICHVNTTKQDMVSRRRYNELKQATTIPHMVASCHCC